MIGRSLRGAIVCGVLLAVALLGPAVFWQSGVIDREATTFVRRYSADRPVLHTVFDPHANDLGTYQARELSYLIDYADARFYAFVAGRTERPFFIPLSTLIASFLFVIIVLAGMRTMTHVDLVAGLLLVICFLASFGFLSTMGVFYRSSKPMLSVVVLAWLFHVRSVQQMRSRAPAPDRRVNARDAAVTFALALVAGLLDRQGFFYVLIACVILYVHLRLTGELRDLLKAAVIAALVLTLYNLVLAPLVIRSLNGYWPDFSYQRLPLSELLRLQVHLSRAIRLLVMNLGMLAGGFSVVAVTVAAAALVLAWRRFGPPCNLRVRRDVIGYLLRDRHGRVVTYGVLLFAFQVAMFAMMIARHGYIFRYVDHRYWYYPMPFLVTVLFGLLLIMDGAMARLSRAERQIVPLLLLVVAAGNVSSLGAYKSSMIEGPYFAPIYRQSEMLKASIASGVPDTRLEPEYRAFFDRDRQLRSEPAAR